MKNTFNLKSILFSLSSGVIALLSTFMAPIFSAFCGVSFGPVCMGLGFLVAFIGAALISGIETAIYVMPMLIASSVILTYMLKGKCAYRTAAISCAIACVVGEYIIMFMPYFIKGYSVAAAVDAYIEPIVSQYAAITTPELAEALKGISNIMLEYAMEIVFASLVLTGVATGFLQTLLAYLLFNRKLGLKKMAPFKTWQLPTSFMWGSLIMFGATIIASLTGVTYASVLTVIVDIIIMCPLALVGVCCAEYFIQIIPEGRGLRRALTYVFAALSMPTSIFMFMIICIADKIFKLRKRIIVFKREP